MKKTTCCVIPAFNEENRIGNVVYKCKKFVDCVIVVDDGSNDNTFDEAKNQGATVLGIKKNKGKGYALRYGCDYACKFYDIVVIIDADLQHLPEDIPRLIDALHDYPDEVKSEYNKPKDIVFTYRCFGGEMPFIFRIGNRIISAFIGILYNVFLRDTQCGYRCFTKETYKKIRWKQDRYSMDSEMIANVGKYGLNYTEIKIKTIYSDRRKGTNVLDGIKIVWNMFWWRFKQN